MPKEIIKDGAGLYDVHVGWAVGQDVQVGIATATGQPLVQALAGGVHDGPVREALDKLTDAGDVALFTSVWGSLDREGCNRLIRVLRTARDKAYGRDE